MWKRAKGCGVLAVALFVGTPLTAQQVGQAGGIPSGKADSKAPAGIKVIDRFGSALVLQASGGSVAIERELGAVSSKSSLELQWIMVVDSSLGLVFDGAVGAEGTYSKPYFQYLANMKMRALKPVTAFEVRFLVFDVWKDFQVLLSFSQLEDLAAGQQKSFKRVWGYYGESQLRDHYISIGYVSRVRLADGSTIVADTAPVLKVAQAIQSSVTVQNLTPKPEPIPSLTPQS
jgi:hypothetical protein